MYRYSNTGSITPAGTVYRYVIHLRLLNLVNVCGSAIGFFTDSDLAFYFDADPDPDSVYCTTVTVIHCMTMNTRTGDFAVLCNFC